MSATKGHSRPTRLPLSKVQSLMADFVMNPVTSTYDSAKKLSSGKSARKVAEQIIKPNTELTSFQRLEVYNRQYWFRLIDCLYDDFPGLLAILGQTRFDRLIKDYLHKHPSESFTLRDLGEHLPHFIKKNPKYTGVRSRAANEMAQFEWAQVIAFDSASLPEIATKDLSQANPVKLKLRLQPYITLLELSYPFDEFVLALRKKERTNSEASVSKQKKHKAGAVCKLPNREQTFLVDHQFDNTLYYKRLSETVRMLQALQKGKTLNQACSDSYKYLDNANRQNEAFLKDVSSWFENWTRLHWLCRIA